MKSQSILLGTQLLREFQHQKMTTVVHNPTQCHTAIRSCLLHVWQVSTCFH
ncbi:hypothetical protein DPMN_137564 [Dreissena polymorpha]|uniref:Uncharacterized protein n=1 Tax=Dreissena polymorpha TaxID=45954 RepID=A0A9D4G5P6_DREPO|nr:hypothetical protein DPMN_137564 [Dreissena polymorpha]